MSRSLLLHLHGPLQSWGARSRFGLRSTEPLPTKSALVGLFAAALGRPRGSDISDLAAFTLIIRIDRPGLLLCDYHTVGANYPKGKRLRSAEGKEKSETLVTERYYLADAAFTIAVTAHTALVDYLEGGLRQPVWAPFLGRRSCPPAEPFLLGSSDLAPVELLQDRLPVVRDSRSGTSVSFRADDPDGEPANVRDVPEATLGHWASYQTSTTTTWSADLDASRFTKDPFDLVAPIAPGTAR
jgi:CRISPR system Cascade subunit CasD